MNEELLRLFLDVVQLGMLMTLQTLRGRETRTERRRIDAVGLATPEL